MMGGMSAGFGGGIQGILQQSAGGTTGLTMGNKAFAKMSKGGGAASVGTRSIAGRSNASRGTRRTGGGTMSRKSKRDEEDFDAMEIEEIQSLIEQAEAAMDEKRKAIR